MVLIIPPTLVVASIMMTTDGPTKKPNFQLWPQQSSSPVAVATDVSVASSTMTTTDGPTKYQNFCLWPQRSSPPTTVKALILMATDGQTENKIFWPSSSNNCHCGYRGQVTTSDPEMVYTRGHHHMHSTVVYTRQVVTTTVRPRLLTLKVIATRTTIIKRRRVRQTVRRHLLQKIL